MGRHGRRAYVVQYWLNHTGWVSVPTVYTSRKSALQRRRRILKSGTKNTFSGVGKIYPANAQVSERILFSR